MQKEAIASLLKILLQPIQLSYLGVVLCPLLMIVLNLISILKIKISFFTTISINSSMACNTKSTRPFKAARLSILRLFEFHQDGQARDPRSLYYCRCQPSDCHQTVQAEDSVSQLSTQIDCTFQPSGQALLYFQRIQEESLKRLD